MKHTTMDRIRKRTFALAAMVGILLSIWPVVGQETVFEDRFQEFEIGGKWKAHGAGEPDGSIGIVGVGDDGSSLRMSSTQGMAGESLGIETSNLISLTGVKVLRVEARFRPLNAKGAGNGGGSDASVGVAVIGSNGAFARVSAGANRPDPPDWGDFYWDSEGSEDTASAAFLHFPPNDPEGAAEAFRTQILEISDAGTSMMTFGSTGELLESPAFEVFNPNLTLADFGASVTIALFQYRSDDDDPGITPEMTLGDIDHVIVSVQAAPMIAQILSLVLGPRDSGEATITFDSLQGRTYTIEASPDLQEWVELADGIVSEGEETAYLDDAIPAGTAGRYYRVRDEM
jgi:hypothetical protein